MKRCEPTLTICPPVELDDCTAPAFNAELEQCAPDAIICIDGTGMMFLASAGLRVLVACRNRQQAGGGDLRVTNPTPIVHRVLEITGMLGLLADR